MENPYYVLNEDKTRAVFPKILKVTSLSIIFFFGIWLNLMVLEIADNVNSVILSVSGIVLIGLIIVELFVAYKKIKPYNFFNDRIEHDGKTAYYSHIQNVEIHKGLFDKIFKTGTIDLEPYLKMKNLHSPDQFLNYVNKLRQRVRVKY